MKQCTEVLALIDDFVDGELDAREAAAIRVHLDGCKSCRDEHEAVRDLLSKVAELPEKVAPGRDLWPEIASRIASSSRQSAPWRRWLAAAAAALVVAGSVVAAYMVGQRQGSTRVVEAPPTPVVAFAAYDQVAAYRDARNELRETLEQRRQSLSPETLAVVEENLAVIDEAVLRIETALQENPGDPRLSRQLGFAYRQEIELLRRASTLPAEL